jgi:hypothetical protein
LPLQGLRELRKLPPFTFKVTIKPEEKWKGKEAQYTDMIDHLYYVAAIGYVAEVIKPLN